MPKTFDFDDVEGLDGTEAAEEQEQAQAAAADAAVDSLYESSPEEPEGESELDSQMIAVEQRLMQAQYYRLLLDNSFFNDESELAQKVDKEIRTFVRGRLQVLMGVKPEAEVQVKQRPPDFTDAEIGALKLVAKRATEMAHKLNAASSAAAPAPAPAPSIKKVETKPESPRQEAPQLRKAPPPIPQAPPPPRKPGAPPPRPQAARLLQRPGQTTAPKIDMKRVPEKYHNDPTLVERGGRLWVQARTPDDEFLWEKDLRTKQTIPMLKDVTLPAAPSPTDIQPVAQPFMGTGNEGLSSPYAQVMQNQSDQLIGLAERKTGLQGASGHLATTLIANLNPNQGE